MTPIRATDGEAIITQTETLSRDVRAIWMKVESPQPFGFKPGQFINVTLPGEEGKRPPLRSYSLAGSSDDPSTLKIVYDTEVPGPGVNYLNALKGGERIKFKGPLGLFVLKDGVLKEPSERPLFIVTHISAIAMCVRVAEAALKASPSRLVTLIYEPKQEDALICAKEMLALAEQYPGFQQVITCPEGSPQWSGPRKTLLEELERRVTQPEQSEVYVCGLGSMVMQVKNAMKDRGITPDRLVGEKWSKGDDD